MNDQFTPQDHLKALLRAKAAGDERAAQAIRERYVESIRQEDAAKYDPAAGESIGTNLRAGIGRGMVNVARHAGNLVGLQSDEDLQRAAEMDAPLMNTGAGKVGSMIGETATLAVPGAGATGLAARAGTVGARLAGNVIGRGALEGSLQGALMADPGDRLAGGIQGGALGAILPASFKGAKKVATGMKRTPEAQALIDKGVDLTPGQMNPGGFFNKLEEDWSSIPGAGSIINPARSNALNQAQRVAIQEAAAPGATIAKGQADEMLDAAYKSFQPLYDAARGYTGIVPKVIRASGGDVPLTQLFEQTLKSNSIPASQKARDTVAKYLRSRMRGLNGTSDSYLELRSDLRKLASDASKGTSFDDRALGKLFDKAQKSITEVLESQLQPDDIKALRLADSKYGTYKLLEDAVARGRDKAGGFSMNDLSGAIKNATEKGAYARGGGTLRDLAQQGKSTIEGRSPMTGQRLGSVYLPLAAGVSNPAFGIPAGLGALGMIGTQTGRKISRGATAPQQAMQQLGSRVAGQISPTQREVLARYLRSGANAGLVSRE